MALCPRELGRETGWFYPTDEFDAATIIKVSTRGTLCSDTWLMWLAEKLIQLSPQRQWHARKAEKDKKKEKTGHAQPAGDDDDGPAERGESEVLTEDPCVEPPWDEHVEPPWDEQPDQHDEDLNDNDLTIELPTNLSVESRRARKESDTDSWNSWTGPRKVPRLHPSSDIRAFERFEQKVRVWHCRGSTT